MSGERRWAIGICPECDEMWLDLPVDYCPSDVHGSAETDKPKLQLHEVTEAAELDRVKEALGEKDEAILTAIRALAPYDLSHPEIRAVVRELRAALTPTQPLEKPQERFADEYKGFVDPASAQPSEARDD